MASLAKANEQSKDSYRTFAASLRQGIVIAMLGSWGEWLVDRVGVLRDDRFRIGSEAGELRSPGQPGAAVPTGVLLSSLSRHGSCLSSALRNQDNLFHSTPYPQGELAEGTDHDEISFGKIRSVDTDRSTFDLGDRLSIRSR